MDMAAHCENRAKGLEDRQDLSAVGGDSTEQGSCPTSEVFSAL